MAETEQQAQDATEASQEGAAQEQVTQEQMDSVDDAIRSFTAGEDIDLDAIYDIPIEVTVVLGETEITVEELLKMGKGSIVTLQRKVGEPVDLFVNKRCVARGEIVVVGDKIGITLTEVIKKEKE